MKRIALTGVMVAFMLVPSLAVAETPLMPSRGAVVRTRSAEAARTTARHWEALVGLRPASTRWSTASAPGYRFWKRRARAVARVGLNVPNRRAWLCIHRFEGSWSDGGDPYWGGLQMDRGFMDTYAPAFLLRRGFANRWTPLEQMWVAERARRSGRGFGPWPNTAHFCGLL